MRNARVLYALTGASGAIDTSDIYSGRDSLSAVRTEQRRALEIYGERLTIAKFKRVRMVKR